jgi:hypothetical protein
MIEFDLFREWLPSITTKTAYLFEKGKEDRIEPKYPSFMINRALSQYSDTALFANECNLMSTVDPKLQYDFLYNIVPSKKRFSKWAKKKENDESINILVETYKISVKKALEIYDLFTEDDIEKLKSYLYKGGKNERKS